MILILMGVTGSGKTAVGSLLARQLGWQFADADDFHPASNIEKIRRGVPLGDDDRAPWLDALRDAIIRWDSEGQNVVLACSALKRSYRKQLRTAGVQFVYLKGDYDLISSRLRTRHGHFASESILKSQFADLEEPDAEEPENVITETVDKTPEAIVAEIFARIGLSQTAYPDSTNP